eukprot:TRINITY_DN15546_c0_g1_i1.p1 TRINITY_DN15546_c0_g1~~TRINITY_DN15546_c0_g1_i1.p1  ORF type:complete len:712 (+),score=231.17 TRINITY_DN15546_c0_g1_i1:69-2204(+)
MDRDTSGFFSGLAGPGRGISINPKDKKKRAEEDDDESWEESTIEEGEGQEFGEEECEEGEEDIEMDEEEEEVEEGEEGAAEEEVEEEGEEDEVEQADTKPVDGPIKGAQTIKIAEGQEQTKTSWLDLPLNKRLQHSIAQNGWMMPTPVQCKAIPASCEGYDVCCRSVTGSGKTGAFLLPVLEKISSEKRTKSCIRAVAVLPSRELAVQCFNMLEQLSIGLNITKSLVIGGLSIAAQQRELRNRPDIVIATPGRLIDSLRNAQGVTLDGLEFLVLDEADRLLSHGFRPQLEELLRFCPAKRQTLLFSATMTKEVNELASLSLDKPINVDVGHVAVATHLTQEFVRLPAEEEKARLQYISCLCTHEFKKGVIVFCEKKSRAARVKVLLELQGVDCVELHQNVSQMERLAALDKFRNREAKVLVTTEVAARGLDIEGVRTVVNYDLPMDVTGYVHRVGRTARIGNTGRAVSFVGTKDTDLMKKVVKLSKVQVGSTQVSKVRRREVEKDRLAEMETIIESLQPKIKERIAQAQMEKKIEEAEKKITKQRNTIVHMEEIKSRPRATWFANESEKNATRKRTREELEAESRADLDDFITGGPYHMKKRKQGEFGSRIEKMEAAAARNVEKAPTGDKYGKHYQPQKIEKMRGKSTKKANARDWLAKRQAAKKEKIEKADKNRKGSGKKIKSGKDKKKEWNFTERAGVSFKSKKRYKRH